jgi:hypothetical protein
MVFTQQQADATRSAAICIRFARPPPCAVHGRRRDALDTARQDALDIAWRDALDIARRDALNTAWPAHIWRIQLTCARRGRGWAARRADGHRRRLAA